MRWGWEVVKQTLKTLFGIAWYNTSRNIYTEPIDKTTGLRDISLALETIPGPYLLNGTLSWHHGLSHDFTGSANCSLEKQSSQLSLTKTLWMGSALVGYQQGQ